MKKTILSLAVCSLLAGVSGCTNQHGNKSAQNTIPEKNQTYAEDWESLSQVEEQPKWFQDAKLGIYAHWGPVSTANIDMKRGVGWYGLNVYMDEVYDWKTGEKRLKNGKPIVGDVYQHHVEAHGPLDKVGYKDIIPNFKPTAFDPEEWAELFAQSGAKFAGPVAMHHDNFAMWDSDVTRWNVKDMMGIDVTGELKKSIEKRDMKFLASFHHAFTWVFFANAYKFDATDETSD
jgi:alpha-L-fucosidase